MSVPRHGNLGDQRAYCRVEHGGAYNGARAGAAAPPRQGLAAGTRLATHMGWRPVQAITVGCFVMTLDHGLQPVRAMRRAVLWDLPGNRQGDQPHDMMPVQVPAGVLGNDLPLVLLPEQGVMVHSEVGEELLGDPYNLIPAAALIGFRGIIRGPACLPVEVVTLCFEDDQVLHADGGALLHCPSGPPGAAATGDYPVLEPAIAALLVEALAWEPGNLGASPPLADDPHGLARPVMFAG